MEARSSLFLSSKISVVYSFPLSFFLSSPKFSSEFSCFETPRKGLLCMLYMFFHLSFSLIHLLMHQIPFIHFEFMLSKRAETARSKYTRKKRLQKSHNPCFFHARWFESYWSIPLWNWSFSACCIQFYRKSHAEYLVLRLVVSLCFILFLLPDDYLTSASYDATIKVIIGN